MLQSPSIKWMRISINLSINQYPGGTIKSTSSANLRRRLLKPVAFRNKCIGGADIYQTLGLYSTSRPMWSLSHCNIAIFVHRP